MAKDLSAAAHEALEVAKQRQREAAQVQANQRAGQLGVIFKKAKKMFLPVLTDFFGDDYEWEITSTNTSNDTYLNTNEIPIWATFSTGDTYHKIHIKVRYDRIYWDGWCEGNYKPQILSLAQLGRLIEEDNQHFSEMMSR